MTTMVDGDGVTTEVVTVDGTPVELTLDDGEAEASVVDGGVAELEEMLVDAEVTKVGSTYDGDYKVDINKDAYNGSRNVKRIAASDDYHIRYVNVNDGTLTIGEGAKP